MPWRFFFTALVFAIPFAFIVVALVREAQSLIVDWPRILESTKGILARASESSWAHRFNLDEDLNLPALQDTVVKRAGEGVQFALVGISALLDASSITFLIIMFTILMVAIREQLKSSAEAIIAQTSETVSAANLTREVSDLIQSFLVARFVITIVVGAAAAIIMMAFKVHYAILLGGLLGVATLIPNIGFLLGIIPPLIIALASGHGALNVVFLFVSFMVIAVLEANVLTPKLVGGKLNINSLTAFLGLFAGGLMWGVWGMLLSIPLLGVVRICLSLSADTRPWADLLAEREDAGLLRRLLPAAKVGARSSAAEKAIDKTIRA